MATSDKKNQDISDNTDPECLPSDLADTARDEKVMDEEAITLDLPDVSDIPGQENIIPPKMGMFADTTISSDDEEGKAVFEEENDIDTESEEEVDDGL